MSETEALTSETIGKLAEALAKAQGQIEGARKENSNPHFKSRYADLASVWDACRAPLAANGLAIVQTTHAVADGTRLTTRLLHSSGEWIRGDMLLAPVKNDPQGVGSALTYARRQCLAAMVGVAPEDDDGNGASGRTQPPAKLPDLPPREPSPADEAHAAKAASQAATIAATTSIASLRKMREDGILAPVRKAWITRASEVSADRVQEAQTVKQLAAIEVEVKDLFRSPLAVPTEIATLIGQVRKDLESVTAGGEVGG